MYLTFDEGRQPKNPVWNLNFSNPSFQRRVQLCFATNQSSVYETARQNLNTMKKLFVIPIFLWVAFAALAQEVHLSAGISDIVKLSQANAGPAVIESFISNSPIAYSPTSDELIYMRKQGVSDEVLAALLKHGTELRRQAGAAAAAPPYQPQAQEEPTQGTMPVPMPQTPAPGMAPQVDYVMPPAPATVVEQVPVYTDGYYWGPGYWGWGGAGYIWIGPGWRWGGWGRGYGSWGRGYAGWGYGGFRGGYGGYGGFHGGYGGYGGAHPVGGHGAVGHAGGGGFGGGHSGGGGHGGGGHR